MCVMCVCLCVPVYNLYLESSAGYHVSLPLAYFPASYCPLIRSKKHARRMFFPPKDSFVLPARCHRMKAEPAIFSVRSFRVNFTACVLEPAGTKCGVATKTNWGSVRAVLAKTPPKNQPLEKWRNFSNTDCHEDWVKGRVSPCQMLTSTVAKWWSVAWV